MKNLYDLHSYLALAENLFADITPGGIENKRAELWRLMEDLKSQKYGLLPIEKNQMLGIQQEIDNLAYDISELDLLEQLTLLGIRQALPINPLGWSSLDREPLFALYDVKGNGHFWVDRLGGNTQSSLEVNGPLQTVLWYPLNSQLGASFGTRIPAETRALINQCNQSGLFDQILIITQVSEWERDSRCYQTAKAEKTDAIVVGYMSTDRLYLIDVIDASSSWVPLSAAGKIVVPSVTDNSLVLDGIAAIVFIVACLTLLGLVASRNPSLLAIVIDVLMLLGSYVYLQFRDDQEKFLEAEAKNKLEVEGEKPQLKNKLESEDDPEPEKDERLRYFFDSAEEACRDLP